MLAENTQSLLKTNPQDKRSQHGLAIMSVKVGNKLGELGSLAEALESSRSGLDLFEALAKDETDARSRRELGAAWGFRGGLLDMNGDARGALAAYGQGLNVAESMAKADPQNVVLQLDMAGQSSALGRVLFRLGNYKTAEVALRRASQLYEQNLAHNPSDAEIPPLLGLTEVWRGELWAKTGKLADALASYREGISSFERLRGDAATAEIRCDTASARDRMGALLARMGNARDASAAYRGALAGAEPMTTTNPPNVRALYAIADKETSSGRCFEIVAIPYVQASWFVRHPGLPCLCDLEGRTAAVTFPSEQITHRYQCAHRVC